MGAKLVAYFQQAKQKGGMSAQVKLAMLTQLSQKTAQAVPDSPENIRKFQQAMAKL